MTKAEQEKAEAEARKRAMQKSGIKVPVDTTPKMEAKKPKKEERSTPKKETKKPKTEKKTKPSYESKGPYFFEIRTIKEYVENNNTVFAMKGVLHKDDDEFNDSIVVFKKDNLPESQWNKTVLYLEKKDIVQLDLYEDDETFYATSIRK